MTSQQKSRWAQNTEDNESSTAQKKHEKQERKRTKEEKLRKLEEQNIKSNKIEEQSHRDDTYSATKRRKIKNNTTIEDSSSTNLMKFATQTLTPCNTIDDYELLNNIEEGSYGFVSRARHRSDGTIVAVKRLKLDNSFQEGFPVTGLREIQTLKASNSHPNIVRLREVVTSQDLKETYLVMDFIEHDMKTLLEDMNEPFLPSEVKTLMYQIVSATEYLHSNWILHRDLKTSNLLLNNRGEIKLADFGMARYTGNPAPKLTQLVVTLWYRAPELLLGAEEYSFEIDIWSVGCIFAELVTREPLFQGRNEVGQLSEIFKLLGLPTNETWPGFRSLPNAKALHPILSKHNTSNQISGINATKFPYMTNAALRLLRSLLSYNPDDRPSASKILGHPYFKEDPRPKSKEMFPTFPSKAGQEKRRRKVTPQAPDRAVGGKLAPKLDAKDFVGLFAEMDEEVGQGAGFASKMG